MRGLFYSWKPVWGVGYIPENKPYRVSHISLHYPTSMADTLKVFKKCSKDGSTIVFLGKRDFIDSLGGREP